GRERLAPEPVGTPSAGELPAPRRSGAGVRAVREDRAPLHQESRSHPRRLQDRRRRRGSLGSGLVGRGGDGLRRRPPPEPAPADATLLWALGPMRAGGRGGGARTPRSTARPS